jgi:hypothetical protein
MLFSVGYGASILCGTGCARNRFSLLESLDLAPLIGRWLCAALTADRERKVKFVRLSVLAIPTASALSDAKEAESLPLAQCGGYGRAVDAIFDEIIERHGQFTVVISAVIAKL